MGWYLFGACFRSIDLTVWVIPEVWKFSISAWPQVQWQKSAEVRRPRGTEGAEVRRPRIAESAEVRQHSIRHRAQVRRNSVSNSAWLRRKAIGNNADVRRCSMGETADFSWNLFSCPCLLLLCSGFRSDVLFLILCSDNSSDWLNDYD